MSQFTVNYDMSYISLLGKNKIMKKYGLILFSLFVIGCESSTINSPLVGKWNTQECKQLSDSNSNLVEVWANSSYTFDKNGNIKTESISYSDSNCITVSNAIKNNSIHVAIYNEEETEITQLGIEATKITISFTSMPPPVTTTDGYYKITDNTLCLSESFQFDSASFSIGSFNNAEIDFNQCLIKNQP